MYSIGDLIIFKDLLDLQPYTGIITDIIKCNDWLGGGYYIIHWEYPEKWTGIADDKASFNLIKSWVNNKEAIVYPAIR